MENLVSRGKEIPNGGTGLLHLPKAYFEGRILGKQMSQHFLRTSGEYSLFDITLSKPAKAATTFSVQDKDFGSSD